ncbi:MAG TPA: hypothetical protein VGQ08_15730 [Nitrospiraceae bacterium]|jgi:hypothetical protein|nr:hypothetical protein [Nitrospiraceae bacterium]
MKRQSNQKTAGSDQADLVRSERREAYLKKFKDPRWQKMRLEVMSRDEFACQICFDSESTLNVHHRYYLANKDPWEYPLEALVTLCETCHESETDNRSEDERAVILALRKHFFSAQIINLALSFERMELTHIPEVVADAIGWAVETPEIQRELVERNFADMMARRAAREAAKASSS